MYLRISGDSFTSWNTNFPVTWSDIRGDYLHWAAPSCPQSTPRLRSWSGVEARARTRRNTSRWTWSGPCHWCCWSPQSQIWMSNPMARIYWLNENLKKNRFNVIAAWLFSLTSEWMFLLVVIHREAPDECFVGLTLIARVMMKATGAPGWAGARGHEGLIR